VAQTSTSSSTRRPSVSTTPACRDVVDAGGLHRHVLPRQRRVVVVGAQHALAAEGVVGGERGAELRVLHLPAQVHAGQPLGDAVERVVGLEGLVEQLVLEVDRAAERGAGAGDVAEREALGTGERPVHPGDDPRWRALEHRQRGGALGQLGDELDRAGAGPDRADPRPVQVQVVVPPRRVQDRAGEVVQPRDGRVLRVLQAAHGIDQHVAGDSSSIRTVQGPGRARLVPGRTPHVEAEPGPCAQPVLGHDPVEVAADLGLGGVVPGPVRVGLLGQRVEVGRDVARGTRVGVVAPGAAGVLEPLQQDEVLDPVLQQPHGHGDPTEAGADDRHAGWGAEVHVVSACRRQPS
jgi:hypothetical protein